jgi:hypothetical protein
MWVCVAKSVHRDSDSDFDGDLFFTPWSGPAVSGVRNKSGSGFRKLAATADHFLNQCCGSGHYH